MASAPAAKAARKDGLSPAGARISGRAGGQGQQAYNAFHYVVNIGEVAAHAAFVKNLDRLAAYNGGGKKVQGHVWSAPRAVYGKKAQPGAGDVVQMTVGMGHKLVTFLGGRIQAYRMVYIVPHRIGLGCVKPVDRR